VGAARRARRGGGDQVFALLRFLQSQKDPQLMTLYQLAHSFLQDFCHNNAQNQELLHGDVDFLMVGSAEARSRRRVCARRH